MNRKIIVFGSFLAVFLMLMVPVVNAIEYNQVENNIKEKTFSYNKLADVEKLRNLINKMKNNPNSSCSTCGINLSTGPLCKILLKLFGIIYFIDGIIPSEELYDFALDIWKLALIIGCKWAVNIAILLIILEIIIQLSQLEYHPKTILSFFL